MTAALRDEQAATLWRLIMDFAGIVETWPESAPFPPNGFGAQADETDHFADCEFAIVSVDTVPLRRMLWSVRRFRHPRAWWRQLADLYGERQPVRSEELPAIREGDIRWN